MAPTQHPSIQLGGEVGRHSGLPRVNASDFLRFPKLFLFWKPFGSLFAHYAALHITSSLRSLGPIHRRLDDATLLGDIGGSAVGGGHTHGRHGDGQAPRHGLHRAGIHSVGDGRNQIRARMHDVRPLEEHFLHADVPITQTTTRAGEAQRRGGRHQRHVRHTRQHHLAHDSVVRVHPAQESNTRCIF